MNIISKEDKKTFSFQPDKEYGYAYSWAQVICGLDFAPIISYEKNIVFSDNNNEIDDPHKLMRYPCFAEIVDLIEERVHSIEALENQISQLSGNTFIYIIILLFFLILNNYNNNNNIIIIIVIIINYQILFIIYIY